MIQQCNLFSYKTSDTDMCVHLYPYEKPYKYLARCGSSSLGSEQIYNNVYCVVVGLYMINSYNTL